MFRRTRGTALIALAIVALLVGAAVVNREASATGAAASANEAVLGTLEARFAISHTWVEEFVVGDTGVDVDTDIRANQANAAKLCRTLRDGGALPRHSRVEPVDDAAASARVGEMCRGIAEFRRLTAARLADPRRQPAGSPGEQRYDVRFAAVIGDADALRVRLEDLGEESRLRARVSEILILVVLVLLLLRAVLAIRGRERELAALAADREAVLNSAGEGILAIDREGLVQFANAAALSALGWSRGELVGQPFATLLPEGSVPDPEYPLPRWMRVPRPTHGDDRELQRRDGSRFPVAYSLTPARAREDGGSLVLTFQDIERRRLLDAERDAELGELRTIKEALVPDAIPDRVGLEIATCHVPAEEGVAGDFLLVAEGPDGRTTFFVGDVAGKGLAAARRGAYVRAALATFAPYESSPGRLLELGNRSLMDAAGVTERFVTVVCVSVNPARGTATWASAGHPAPIRLDSGTPLEGPPSLPLGLSAALELRDQTVELPVGSGLLLHTDGLSEARADGDGSPDLLGAERVRQLVCDRAGSGCQPLIDDLRALAERHSEGHLADDLCLVALRLMGVRAAASTGESPSPVRAAPE